MSYVEGGGMERGDWERLKGGSPEDRMKKEEI